MALRQIFIGILSDVVLWIIVLALLIIAARFLFISHPESSHHGEQEIMLAFHDASQLQEGSPVDLMGTDIGYVNKVRAVGNQVRVTFKTYTDALKIPAGSHFTIEFNGLAGAKSLEVLPPTDWAPRWPDEGFHVYEPIRLRDVYKTQQVMAEGLEYAMRNLDQSLGSTSDIKTFPLKVQTLNHNITYAHQVLNTTDKFIAHQSVVIPKVMHRATRSIDGFYRFTLYMQKFSNPTYFKSNSMQSMRGLMKSTKDLYYNLGKAVSEQHVTQLREQMRRRNEQFVKLNEKVEQTLPNIWTKWAAINADLGAFNGWVNRAVEGLSQKPLQQRYEDFQINMDKWHHQTNDLEKKLLKKEKALNQKKSKKKSTN